MKGARWAVPLLALLLASVVTYGVRMIVASWGFLALLMAGASAGGVVAYAIGTNGSGEESRTPLVANTDYFNLAYWRYGMFKGSMDLLDLSADACYEAGIKPNVLTMSSLVAVVAAGYCLLQCHVVLGIAFWLYYVFVDELDGHLARKHKLCSEMGAYLDLLTDTMGQLFFCWGTLCATDNDVGKLPASVAISGASFLVSVAQQQVYDDALEVGRGVHGLDVAGTALYLLGFMPADASRSQVKAQLPALGMMAHGFNRVVASPIIAFAFYSKSMTAQFLTFATLVLMCMALRRHCSRNFLR